MLHSYDAKTIIGEKKIALLASIAGLTALALDIFYGMAKGIRETANQTINATSNSAALKGAANVQRGAIKFASGCLGATTGVLSAVLDFNKYDEQTNKVGGGNRALQYIYLTRGIISALGSVFLSFLATITYLEPVLNYLKHKGRSPLLTKLGERTLIKVLIKDAVRAALLRVVAWAGSLVLILTILEVAVYIYMEFTKLESWCKSSTFRKDKSKKLMSEKQETEGYQNLFI